MTVNGKALREIVFLLGLQLRYIKQRRLLRSKLTIKIGRQRVGSVRTSRDFRLGTLSLEAQRVCIRRESSKKDTKLDRFLYYFAKKLSKTKNDYTSQRFATQLSPDVLYFFIP